jgi:hypothetical protein
MRAATANVREHLVRQLNDGLMRPWCERNGWLPIEITVKPTLFTARDWASFRDELLRGELGPDDIWAAESLDAEAIKIAEQG